MTTHKLISTIEISSLLRNPLNHVKVLEREIDCQPYVLYCFSISKANIINRIINKNRQCLAYADDITTPKIDTRWLRNLEPRLTNVLKESAVPMYQNFLLLIDAEIIFHFIHWIANRFNLQLNYKFTKDTRILIATRRHELNYLAGIGIRVIYPTGRL